MRKAATKKAVCRETPQNALSLAPAFSNAVMRLQARVASDPEFLPLLIAETRAGGFRAALLADAFEEVFDARRAARLARRDAALVEASGFYSGSLPKIGKQLAGDLRRYEQNDWRRKDHRLDAYPESPFRTVKACFFDVLKSGGEKSARGDRQITDTLKRCFASENHGNLLTDAVSGKSHDTLDGEIIGSNAEMGTQDIDRKKFLDALEAHPIGVEIKNTAQDETVAARKKLVDALAANEAKADREFPLLAKGVDTAVAKVRAAEKALQAANDDLWKANQAKSNANFTHMGERQRLEGLLSDTEYSETITDFQREMRWGMDDVRKQFEFHTEVSVNALTGEPMRRGYNNRASIDARISAMRAAIDQAEALRLIADQSNVPEQLSAIRAGLPKVSPAVDPTEKRA